MKKLALIFAVIASPILADCVHEEQVEVLALNMYHEARGEPMDGMQMVGEVTLNRVEASNYPDTICDVVYQPHQFSWTHTVKNHEPQEVEIWLDVLVLAENLILGEVKTFGNGATHFINPDKVRRIPNWARQFEKVGKIGNHVFYQQPS